ncbi:MAG: DNA polymerase IV [Acidothermus sp.]|nr:DNA polymerase IV [Acidothermus sp.]MCL6537183.1 DNA polymerase IV [Acidothermus sp.]
MTLRGRASVGDPQPRRDPSILHADIDAFFAAVEQRDKPSLRGRPVVVGGLGPRGVVATASYEARAYGVHSAMSMAQARLRCPHAAFLAPRFAAYRAASATVMGILAGVSPTVEQISLDEAYVDLASTSPHDLSVDDVRRIAVEVKERVRARTGLSISIGAGNSKLVAKIASDLDKPDGLRIVAAGTEREFLAGLPVGRIPGVGPATAARLSRLGITTIGALAASDESELVNLLGRVHGRSLWLLARGLDDRPVSGEREAKSVSVEDTFDSDITDSPRLRTVVTELAHRLVTRLRRHGLSGRTISLKIRLADFTTLTRSLTLAAPTDDQRVITASALRLLDDVDTSGGVRLAGVGISALSEWSQPTLFSEEMSDTEEGSGAHPSAEADSARDAAADGSHDAEHPLRWTPGQDVEHDTFGRGWVQGAGSGWVTVRFETADTPPGPVRSFRIDDPALQAIDEL